MYSEAMIFSPEVGGSRASEFCITEAIPPFEVQVTNAAVGLAEKHPEHTQTYQMVDGEEVTLSGFADHLSGRTEIGLRQLKHMSQLSDIYARSGGKDFAEKARKRPHSFIFYK